MAPTPLRPRSTASRSSPRRRRSGTRSPCCRPPLQAARGRSGSRCSPASAPPPRPPGRSGGGWRESGRMVRMPEEWETGQGAVALIGDSLTQSGDWAALLPGETVWNFGVAGDTTDDVLARLDDVIGSGPATVALLIGTNDLAWRRSAEHVVRN